MISADSKRIVSVLAERLQRGEHIVLYGPRGSGKSTLLEHLRRHFAVSETPCAYAALTSSLAGITESLALAYPDVDVVGVARRLARARLRAAADCRPGILLLDHAAAVNSQMVGYLRRLRGGIVGVLIAADVDTDREREQVRAWHLAASPVRMPSASATRLRRLFRDRCREAGVLECVRPWERQILRAARGRIGWISQCTRFIDMPRYWNDTNLYAAVLCSDTEMALRDPDLVVAMLGKMPRAGQ